MKGRLWILAGLIVLQAVLSWTMFIHAPHNGGDNAGYVALGNALATGQGYVETWDPAVPAHTKYPPVFPALIGLLITFGVTTWTGFKSIAFLASILVTAGTFLWASRRIGRAAGAGVALLTGCSWSLLWHSSYVLSDVPFVAFTMIALWAVEEATPTPDASEEVDDEPPSPSSRWLIIAGVGAFLAYFTRSAGLPLVLAILGALALRKMWRPAATMALGVGIPAAIWFARSLTAGSDEGRYASEFLLVDPYDPARGAAGVADFAWRIFDNTIGYATDHLPRAFSGSGGGWLAALSLCLMLLAFVGWVHALRQRRGPAELFLPLYIGLILIWPVIWSGDRFALPLLPLLYLYAAEGIGLAQGALRDLGVQVARGAVAAVLLFAMFGGWWDEASYVRSCNGAVAEAGPWACSGRATAAFTLVADWAGRNLPAGTTVLARKPRIFHVQSGLTSRTYPFVESSEVFFEEAAAAGANHTILDGVGAQGRRFLAPTIVRNPDRFCERVSIGLGTSSQAVLVGILQDRGRPEGGEEETGANIAVCPVPGASRLGEPLPGPEIPLLTRAR